MPKGITEGRRRRFKRGRKERRMGAMLSQVKGVAMRVFERTGADWRRRRFFAWRHFCFLLAMHSLGRRSLRGMYAWWEEGGRLEQQAGLGEKVSFSQIARSHTSRSSRCWEELFYELVSLVQERRGSRKLGQVWALDSSFFRLSPLLSPWLPLRREGDVRGLKLHLLVSAGEQVPLRLELEPGWSHDLNGLRALLERLPAQPGSILLFDRGYRCYPLWDALSDRGVFFITRLTTAQVHVTPLGSLPLSPEHPDILRDEVVHLGRRESRNRTRHPLRWITLRTPHGQIDFVTNHLSPPASDIAQLYRFRWQVEVFFRYLKHDLNALHWLGHSLNAVRTTLLIALIMRLLAFLLFLQTGLPTATPLLQQRLFSSLYLEEQLLTPLCRSPDCPLAQKGGG